MSNSALPVVLICCSVLRAEMMSLHRTHWPNHTLRFLDSLLHMHPQRLWTELVSLVEENLNEGRGLVLVYGDCCARMTALESRPGLVRTVGHNCCELLLGRAAYRRLSHEGAFFLLPEWAHRWPEVMATELGLSHGNATDLMRDMHRKLLYLDTGVVPVPTSALQACGEYCGLPWVVQPVTLEILRATIDEALLRLNAAGGPV